MGIGLFFLGGVDYVLNLVARSNTLLAPDGRSIAMTAAVHCGAFGILAIAFFTARVFHPQSRWAIGIVMAAALGLLACAVGQGLSTVFYAVAARETPAYFMRGFNLIQSAILTWTCIESLRYAGAMRRRAALGLADPVVVDRIRLWGRAAATASAIYAVYAVGELLGADLLNSAKWNVLLASLGLASASCIALAFFPPRAYLERVRREAPLAR